MTRQECVAVSTVGAGLLLVDGRGVLCLSSELHAAEVLSDWLCSLAMPLQRIMRRLRCLQCCAVQVRCALLLAKAHSAGTLHMQFNVV
jgi:hypothetical protein